MYVFQPGLSVRLAGVWPQLQEIPCGTCLGRGSVSLGWWFWPGGRDTKRVTEAFLWVEGECSGDGVF